MKTESGVNYFSCNISLTFRNDYYRHEYIQYIRAVWKGCHHWIQGDNKNKKKWKFQSDHTEVLEESGIKTPGIKQAQIWVQHVNE